MLHATLLSHDAAVGASRNVVALVPNSLCAVTVACSYHLFSSLPQLFSVQFSSRLVSPLATLSVFHRLC